MHKMLLAAVIALTVSAGSLAAAPATYKEPLDAQSLDTIRLQFSKLMELANRHDFKALHEMFWQSPSTLLVAKNAIPSRATGLASGQRGYRSEATRHRHFWPSPPRAGLFEAQGRRPNARYCGVLCPLNITVSYAGRTERPSHF